MLEWIALAKTIAEVLGIGVGVIQAGNEILRLVNHHKAQGNQKTRRVGYVYVVQEIEFSKRCRIGCKGDDADWLSELGKQIPGTLEPILVIPTDDTRRLEHELHKIYGTNRNVGNWLELTEVQVTELRQLQVVVDLATGYPVSGAQDLDSNDLEQAKRLFELLLNVSKNEARDKVVFPDGKPSADLDLKSLPPVNYRGLPKLKGSSGYLLVFRNAENKLHRIVGARDPVRFIEEALGSVNHRFGLELILILESAQVNQVEENLSILYPADDDNGWRHLSRPQLQEIRNLAVREKVHRALIITPKTHWGTKTCSIRQQKNLPNLEDPKGYVCVVQGAKRGNNYKIWRTNHPNDSGGIFGMAGQLNNPHDALHSRRPVRFRCIIRTEYAKEFERFLKERYKRFKKRSDILKRDDWYKLTTEQLQEICNFGM